MRKLLTLVLFGLASLGTLGASSPDKPKSHGNSLSGTVVRVDDTHKTFVVRADSGIETTLIRTAATHVRGGLLKPGHRVSVRWLARDGKKLATSLSIEPPVVAAATPTAPALSR